MTVDPNETLLAALRALLASDFDGARDYLSYYHDWRNKGGFEPRHGDFRAEHTSALLRAMMPDLAIKG